MEQKYSKAWSTRRTPGVFSVFSLLQSLKSCCTDIQREEITCAALGEKAVRVPSAFVMLLKAGSHATRAVGKAQRGGKLAWKKPSEVSFHRERHRFLRRDRGSVPLCVHSRGHMPSGWPLQGSTGNRDRSHHGH